MTMALARQHGHISPSISLLVVTVGCKANDYWKRQVFNMYGSDWASSNAKEQGAFVHAEDDNMPCALMWIFKGSL